MTPAEVFDYTRTHGITMLVDGDRLVIRADDDLPSELVEAAREHKPVPLAELWREQFRDRVWRQLQARPDKIKYFEIVDPDADPVRLVLAIRDVGTSDLLIALRAVGSAVVSGAARRKTRAGAVMDPFLVVGEPRR